MKKILLVVSLLVVPVVYLSGCASDASKKVESAEMKDEFANAPKWVFDTSEVKKGMAAVASARMSKAGMQFTRTEALANARDELARQMSIKVKNMVKNFSQATGIGDDESVDRVAAQVSKQVTNQTLVGSKQKDTWISPSNELYVLVIIDSKEIAKVVKESVRTSYKDEKALWQQFQAKKAQEELDSEIEKEFGYR